MEARTRLNLRNRAYDWMFLLCLTVMWGSAFMLTKVAVTGLAPDRVVGGRIVIALLILLPLGIAMAGRLPSGRRTWIFFTLIAFFGNVLPFSLISWGQQYIDSSLAGILMAVMPLVTLVLAHFTLPGERLTSRRAGGFTLGFFGVALLLGPDAMLPLHGSDEYFLPMLAVVAGAVSYSIAAILSRLRPDGDAVSSAAATTLVAAVLLLPGLFPASDLANLSTVGHAQIVAVILLGIFSTAIATVVYFHLITRAGPSFVSQLNYLIPVWAVLIGYLLLGETPQERHLYALVLILAGILLSQWQGRRTRSLRRQEASYRITGFFDGCPQDLERMAMNQTSQPQIGEAAIGIAISGFKDGNDPG